MAKFFGIGIGPGDKELITVKAVRVLSNIDVVILPEARKDTGSTAYSIAKEYINPTAKVITCEFPMVKDKDAFLKAGEKAAQIVMDYVTEGYNTAFLTLGDPSIYSTYIYILKALDSRIEIETIPGITSFCAAAAMTNRVLVEGDEILSIIPATCEYEMMNRVAKDSAGVVVMKLFNHGDKAVRLLKENNMIENSVIVKKCGMADCKINSDIEESLEEGKQYLSIILGRRA